MKSCFLSTIKPRFIIQLFFLILVVFVALSHQYLGIEKAAPIDAYCPFGAVESFFTLIFTGEFLKRVFVSSFILLGIFLVANIFLGRVFCGYVCPIGTISEYINVLGKKLGIKKDIELPKNIDKYLRYIKYILLVIIVYYSFYLNNLVFRDYDPYASFAHFGNEFDEIMFGYLILIFILIFSFFTKSWWCRYFCPLGAFFGIFKKISFFKIKRNKNTCINCKYCDKQCPANLDISTSDIIKDADCISCGKCIEQCPKNSLSYTIFNHTISKNNFIKLVILLIILPIIIVPFTPWWQTKPLSNIVDSHGNINVDNIRGSNTLQYVLEVTKVPFEEFEIKLNIPKDIDRKLKLKEIKNKNGELVEAEGFREVIRNYMNNNN